MVNFVGKAETYGVNETQSTFIIQRSQGQEAEEN